MRFLPLLFCLAVAHAQVGVVAQKNQVDVTIDGQPYTTLYFGPDTTKPYLHPLRAASGKLVSRRFPMDNVDGESKDHPHHRGLWFSHGDVNGWDFWANEKSQKGVGKGSGVIALDKLVSAKGGKKAGEIKANFTWKDGTGKSLLAEQKTIRIEPMGKSRVIDLDIQLTALDTVKFGDTKEGVFAIRLAKALEETQTGTMRSASGAMKEKAVWGTASPWVDYTGTIEGESLGIAIFDHPKNPRHPTYWHSRAYGLFAANIFGVRDFTRDKTKNGDLELKTGEKLHFRYRVLIHPDGTEAAGISKLYESWAK
ncbi:MAG: PmoA family protein [Bryobacteraceae bacterium]|nr:PmoA family protein [Bryobacteraceae bacterium]